MKNSDYNITDLIDYDLNSTLLGGQSFNWDLIDGWYYGFFKDKVVKLKQDKNELYWQTYPVKDDFDFIKNYLRLDIDYTSVLSKINKDKWMNAAIQSYPNLRILKQDFEQTLISYIISANNNIPRIRSSIRNLSERLGSKLKVDDKDFYLFPSAESIADTSVETLQSLKLGYRAKYVRNSAGKLVSEDRKLTEDEDITRKWLLEFPGVGEKVADAVLQYSLSFDNVTPLDVWLQRILADLYKVEPKMSYKGMRKWVQEYFNGYAGWAGQFLYEFYRREYKNVRRERIEID